MAVIKKSKTGTTCGKIFLSKNFATTQTENIIFFSNPNTTARKTITQTTVKPPWACLEKIRTAKVEKGEIS